MQFEKLKEIIEYYDDICNKERINIKNCNIIEDHKWLVELKNHKSEKFSKVKYCLLRMALKEVIEYEPKLNAIILEIDGFKYLAQLS